MIRLRKFMTLPGHIVQFHLRMSSHISDNVIDRHSSLSALIGATDAALRAGR